MVDGAASRSLDLREGGRRLGLGPALAEIGRAKDRRPQVSGACRREQGARRARILHDVMHHRAQEVWPPERPLFALAITLEQERALARPHEEDETIDTPLGFCHRETS